MTTLHLLVDRSAAAPIHRQVYAGIREAILSGRLRPGQRVPSTRGLAIELGVSRLPVLTAYDQLLHEGYLTGRTGRGTFVSASVPDDLLASSASRQAPIRSARAQPRRFLAPETNLAPFQLSLPALDRFPRGAWARLVSRHAKALGAADMAYGDPAGAPALREAVAEPRRLARAVRCEAEQVVIVSGSQAALRVIAAALFAPGDRVAIEEPGYFGAHAAFRSAGVDLVPVPVDGEGLSVGALRRRGARIRGVYVTPSHQYPLGVSMSAGRRLALLDWAQRRNAWVLEDDYDSEFRYVSRPLGALQGMDAHERVVYIGTFSKSLFPALRVGYLVVPPGLTRRLVLARRAFDFFPPTLYQLALAEFLREGHFARHLRRMRVVYAERRDALLDALARHGAGRLAVRNADAGLHVTVELAAGLDDVEVVDRLQRRGLAAASLSRSYLGPSRRNGLLLGFGGFAPERLHDAVRVLAEVVGSG